MCNLVAAENPLCALHIGDLNCRSSDFWSGDTDNDAGNLLVSVLNDTGLHQLVNEPTHFIGDSKSCLDLVITDQPNFINECSMLPSLHSTCHHSINHIVLNINVPSPPAFKRKIWHYDRAQNSSIIASINQYDWVSQLGALAYDPNLQVKLLTDVLTNIFTNFIPNEERVVKPRDPPWMTKNITHSYRKYKKEYKRFIRNGCPAESSDHIETLKNDHTKFVTDAQEKYLVNQGMKMSNSETTIQQIWAIINSFLKKSKSLIIPPILFNNVFIADIQEKANLFNDYFTQQCTLLDGKPFPVSFDKSDIQSILNKLQPNKAHGWDGISIRMIKMCADSIVSPLLIIYKNCILKGVFPSCWKMANVVPIHKKNEKNIHTNYRPISLLPIFSKVFERLIFTSLYSYLIDNKFITNKQSGSLKVTPLLISFYP